MPTSRDLPPRTNRPTLETLLSPFGVPEDELSLLSPDDVERMMPELNKLLGETTKVIATTEAQIRILGATLEDNKVQLDRIIHVVALLWQLEQSRKPF